MAQSNDFVQKSGYNVSGIYGIMNTFDKKIYIGSSIHIYKRWWQHKKELSCNIHDNKHLQSAWNKYGKDSFVFMILSEIAGNETLLIEEQKQMDIYESYHRDFGYNLRKHAESNRGMKHGKRSKEFREFCSKLNKGRKHSPETRAKMSLANIGKKLSDSTKAKISEALKGRECMRYWLGKKQSQETKDKKVASRKGYTHSDETRAKIGLANKKTIVSDEQKKILSDTHRKPVIQFDIMGTPIKEWYSVIEASKELTVDRSSISQVCRGKQKTAGGFVWKFKTEEQ